jgi:hypothetical protein
VANLVHATLFMPAENCRLAILTGNKTAGFKRSDNPSLGKPLRATLSALEALDLVNWRYSTRRGEASFVAPTARLRGMVGEAGVVGPDDFGRLDGEEVIILTRKSRIEDWPPTLRPKGRRQLQGHGGDRCPGIRHEPHQHILGRC